MAETDNRLLIIQNVLGKGYEVKYKLDPGDEHCESISIASVSSNIEAEAVITAIREVIATHIITIYE